MKAEAAEKEMEDEASASIAGLLEGITLAAGAGDSI